jgi:casein kinase 1
LHVCNYIHRDVKPGNMAVGLDSRHKTIFIIDFGLSKQYRDRATKLHLPANINHAFVGTRAYASMNINLRLAPTRRDDLESWFYCLVEWVTGSLPWCENVETEEQMNSIKMQITP